MAYQRRFRDADDVIAHLNGVVPSLTDPLLVVKYVGFVSVVCVTVYELAIKDIFCDFASKKHRVLGHFTEAHFKRINGRIKRKDLEDEYVARFGAKYTLKFKKELQASAKKYLATHGRDIMNSYANLITWRHAFAHEGTVASSATYREVTQAYEDGKEVIHSLARAMTR